MKPKNKLRKKQRQTEDNEKNKLRQTLANNLELQEIMMLDDVLDAESNLEELEAYDSMAHLTLLGLFEDEFGRELEAKDLVEAKTVKDLLALAGIGV